MLHTLFKKKGKRKTEKIDLEKKRARKKAGKKTKQFLIGLN